MRQLQANDLLKLDQDHLGDPAVQAYFAAWHAFFHWGLHKLPVTFGHPGCPLPSFDWSEASLELSITDVWSFFKLLESDEEAEISPDSRLNLENLRQWHLLL